MNQRINQVDGLIASLVGESKNLHLKEQTDEMTFLSNEK